MAGRMEFDLGFGGSRRTARPRDDDEPMRLLVVGDFSHAPVAERPPLADRPTIRVDIDNLDDVMRRLAPRATLAVGEVRVRQLDDFHPDRLYASLSPFQDLRQARVAPAADAGDMLGRLLGKPSAATGVPAASAATPANAVDALIRSIVTPHVVADTSAQTQAHTSAVDAALTEQMRRVLHDPQFQAIEAAWRGVHWLVSSLELDENLQLHLFDVSRDELLADVVAAQGKIAATGVYRALVDRWRRVPGSLGWSAVVGLFEFGPSHADIALLGALGLLATQMGAPFLATASTSLTDEGAAAEAWQALRRSEVASSIGLAAPRVLLRQPYGKGRDPIESFAFEEFAGTPVHEDFLWGSPALATALLLGRSFSASGWEMEPGDEREIGDLPAVTLERDGERVMQACAESYLSESQLNGLVGAGLIPFASRRDRNAVVAIRIQSIADPPAPLAW